VEEEELSNAGKYKYPLNELTRLFELSFEYVKADYQPAFAFYGMDFRVSDSHIELGEDHIMKFLAEF